MPHRFRFARYQLPGRGRRMLVVYRVTDEAGRVLGYVEPTVAGNATVVWRCLAPYVPFPELAGDHQTREAAGAHLGFLLSLREFRHGGLEAAE